MAGESVYGPHDYLVGEGAVIAEAGEPAFLRRSYFGDVVQVTHRSLCRPAAVA